MSAHSLFLPLPRRNLNIYSFFWRPLCPADVLCSFPVISKVFRPHVLFFLRHHQTHLNIIFKRNNRLDRLIFFLFYFVNIYSHEAYVTLYTLITNKRSVLLLYTSGFHSFDLTDAAAEVKNQKVCNLGCSPNVTLNLLAMSVHESAVRNIIYIYALNSTVYC